MWGFGRERKLVTEDWKPVGSGRFRDLAQGPIGPWAGLKGLLFSLSQTISTCRQGGYPKQYRTCRNSSL